MTEPQLLKEMKINRCNAKAALTRAGKSLRIAIESKRPGKDVSDFLYKVQEAYETLIVKHEEFTKLIEDDKEFESQEAWLEESQDTFLSLLTRAKLYLDSSSTEVLREELNVKKSSHDGTELRDSPETLRTVPTIVTAHTFCASRDTRVSYGWCLLIQEYFCAD